MCVEAGGQLSGLLVQRREIGMLDLPAATTSAPPPAWSPCSRRPRRRPPSPPPPSRRSGRDTRQRCWWRDRSPACPRREPYCDRPSTPPPRTRQAPGYRVIPRRPRRRPSRPGALDPQQDCATLRAPQHFVLGGGRDPRQLATVDLDLAGATPTPLQQPGPGAAERPLALIQRNQIRIQPGTSSSRRERDWWRSWSSSARAVIARPLRLCEVVLQLVDLRELARLVPLQLLAALHHLQQRVLQG